MLADASRFQSVTLRLTFWFCAVFTVLSAAVFGLVYTILATSLRTTAENDLRENLVEFAAMYGNKGLAGLQGEFDREAESDGPDTVFLLLLGPVYCPGPRRRDYGCQSSHRGEHVCRSTSDRVVNGGGAAPAA